MGGHAVASVPTSKVMDVYNAFKGIVPSSIPNNLFSLADPLAAAGAAKAFYDFKDVVRPRSSPPSPRAQGVSPPCDALGESFVALPRFQVFSTRPPRHSSVPRSAPAYPCGAFGKSFV